MELFRIILKTSDTGLLLALDSYNKQQRRKLSTLPVLLVVKTKWKKMKFCI